VPPAPAMRIEIPDIARTCPEPEIYNHVLALDHKDILELGCGRAELTRLIATGGPGRRITALEVDQIQHALNLQITDLPNVEFKLGGAERIPAPDRSFDVVFMFKSLHHVPLDRMDAAFAELHRVLRPGGYAYISEPIFAGPFNEILRLFHNEQSMRAAAFAAVERAVARGLFELAEEIFFNSPVQFRDFEDFERKVIGVTHTQHRLSPETYAEVKARITGRTTADGVRFEAPMRVDLLRRPV
jgi:SAM-dependent methyltransferase